MATDLLGNELTDVESRLLAVYDELKSLAAGDLVPCAASNVGVALSALGVLTADLGLRYEHLVELGS